MTALRLERLEAGYGRNLVLRGVDLVVPSGATVALLGANGAGKSTLLKTAAGLLPARNGSIWLGERRIDQLSDAARARLGLCLLPDVSQGIFRQLRVRENIALFCGGRNVAAAIERAAETFPILGKRLSQEAGSMSGGEQQMLSVSRALIEDGSVVMADELSLGLAPVVIDEIYEVMVRLKAEQRSVLLVEQYVSRALTLADYVYILHKGSIVFLGEPAQCLDEHIFERYLGSVGTVAESV